MVLINISPYIHIVPIPAIHIVTKREREGHSSEHRRNKSHTPAAQFLHTFLIRYLKHCECPNLTFPFLDSFMAKFSAGVSCTDITVFLA